MLRTVAGRQFARTTSRAARRGGCVLLALAALGVAACVNITDPPLPAGAQVLSAPELYARWWAMTEACSGATGSFDAVTWIEVPDVSGVPLNGRQVGAYWSLASNRIVVAGNSALEGGLIRHEMLHALTQAGHTRELYLGACAGVVDCDVGCVAQAGPPPAPDPASVTVPPANLAVTVEVAEPGALLQTREGEYLALWVTAHNRATRPVVVDLPVVGPDRRLGFGYDIRGPSGSRTSGLPALDASRWTIAPGEKKRQLFEVYSKADLGVERFSPGDYVLRGSFGGLGGGALTLQVGP